MFAVILVWFCGAPIALGAGITLAGRAVLTVALFTAGRYMLTLFPLMPGAPGLPDAET